MNKSSLTTKLFTTVCFLFLFLIMSVFLLNKTVLEPFYRNEKEHSLIKIFNQAVEYYKDSSLDNSSDFFTELVRIDSLNNMEIIISDMDSNVIMASSNNFLRNGFFFRDLSIAYRDTWEDLQEGQYKINQFTDSKMNSDFITLSGRLTEDYIISIRTPLESIRESVDVSNKFLLIVGTICTIISLIITFIVSKSFVKPIKELDDIANKMSNLDFSKKYNVETNDEIGTLGNSINTLSSNLEKTINDLKNANMELEKDVEETSKISEMRNQFISDVSHELKTPISLIQGYAEGLSDGIITDEEDKKYYIDVILDEANKMSNLTKDLLDLSRLEYGKEELIYDNFSITELVNNTLKKNELLFNEKGITYSLESEENYIGYADHNRIEQVITNYISNAIKNVNEDKIIKCSITPTSEDTLRIKVFNSGHHIADEDMPRLWTRFYKVDSSRNREIGGTGIGLSLVKAIMTQHGQKYGACNVDGGVEFWFEIQKEK